MKNQAVSVEEGVEIVRQMVLREQERTGKMVLVQVLGGSASGKTSQVIPGFLSVFRRQDVLSYPMDRFYKGSLFVRGHWGTVSEVKPGIPIQDMAKAESFDEPAAIDLGLASKKAQLLLAGRETCLPVYKMAGSYRTPEVCRIKPREEIVLLYDGLFMLPNIQKGFVVYVAASPHGRLIRRLCRDLESRCHPGMERDRFLSMTLKYVLGTVFPMHKRYIEPISEQADVVIEKEYDYKLESLGLPARLERYFLVSVEKHLEIVCKIGGFGVDQADLESTSFVVYMGEEREQRVLIKRRIGQGLTTTFFEYTGYPLFSEGVWRIPRLQFQLLLQEEEVATLQNGLKEAGYWWIPSVRVKEGIATLPTGVVVKSRSVGCGLFCIELSCEEGEWEKLQRAAVFLGLERQKSIKTRDALVLTGGF